MNSPYWFNMRFISWAQNFEDVMLWRALKHVEDGFYIDVGALYPDQSSVTRAFYERGWHGINIEPHPDAYTRLNNARPNDINLRLVVSDTPGQYIINFTSEPGLSTLDDSIAQRHKSAGFEITRDEVQAVTLAQIWDKHVPEGQHVHFIKVDVEGMESLIQN